MRRVVVRRSALAGIALVSVVLVGLLAAGSVLTGCGLGTGPTESLSVDEPLGSSQVTDVTLKMGAGRLSLAPGASGLVSGTIMYNVAAWKPEVVRTESAVTIEQGPTKGLSGVGKVVNDWQLKLGDTPIRLTVSAGAYQGAYELGGIPLRGLSIKDGAAKSTVAFSSPNPDRMESLTYETGASSVTLTGLADANFKEMSFEGGAGTYTLDFSGELRTSGSVSVQTGVSKIEIVVPAGTAAKVVLEGKLTSVDQVGGWLVDGKTYSTQAASSDPKNVLTISVRLDVGSLTLTSK